MGRFRQFAEQVTAVQELGAMMQRKFARIIGDDAAGIDDDGLDLRFASSARATT